MQAHFDQVSHDKPSLKRALTLPLLTLYGVGVTLGAGIYVLVGATADQAGIHAPISFLVAAIVVSITALSYAELATRFPVSAGEAAFVEAGFGSRQLTLGVGLLVALSGIVSASAVTIGAASYLAEIIDLPASLLALIAVLTMGLLAAWGIAESVTAAAIITVVEIAGLLLVISWCFGGGSELLVPASALLPTIEGTHWIGIGSAAILAFFAFIGFEDMANVAEEVKRPTWTFPRAVGLTLGITTLLYILTTAAVVMTVPIDELAGSAAPLALAFRNAPGVFQDIFAAIAVFATINGILIQIIMASRVVFGLADRGYLPSPLAHISARTRTPIAATALIVAIIVLLSQTFPIEVLAERTSQIVLLVFILVNLSLVRLKRRVDGPGGDHFTIPAFVPVAGALVCAMLLASAFVT